MIPNDIRTTDSQKRVITLLKNKGDLTKRQLAKKGKMSWSTVVKAINQLQKIGIIACKGTSKYEHLQKGKNAYLYGLANEGPPAIGIDVEHQTTNLILTNLAGTIRYRKKLDTPQSSDEKVIEDFLFRVVSDFSVESNFRLDKLAGIGIGLPSLSLPTYSSRANLQKAKNIEKNLAARLASLVRVDTNTNAYAVFEKWNNSTFVYSDFIFISIRTGVGTGIFYNGNLFQGTRSLLGGIGHMKVYPGGPVCRCGATGCLETVINQNLLFEKYRKEVLGAKKTSPRDNDRNAILAGLSDLFSRAKGGEKKAKHVIDTSADYLGIGLANTISLLGIENVILSGHFGKDGDYIIKPVMDAIRKNLLYDSDINLVYAPFDADGHTLGAALLVLREFFVDIPER
jgi:predicted NBD/HSP70 family sugar kinase